MWGSSQMSLVSRSIFLEKLNFSDHRCFAQFSQLWNHLPLCPVALCFTCNKLCNMDWLYLNRQLDLHYRLRYRFLTDVTKAVSGGRTGPSGSVYGGGKCERRPWDCGVFCVWGWWCFSSRAGVLGLNSRKWGWISRKQKLEAQNKASEDDMVNRGEC